MASVKGRRRTGSLYRRWKGKNYPVDDPVAKKAGTIYLRYKINGKSISQSLGTADIDEARKKQAQIMRPLELASEEEALDVIRMKLERAQKAKNKEVENNHPPLLLCEAWDEYLSSQNRPQSGERTLEGYSSIVKQFVQWVATTYPSLTRMNEVRTEEAEAYARHLASRKLSPSSYNQHLGALSLVWSVLYDKAQAEINPFAWDRKTRKGIQRRSIKAETYQRRKRALSIEEVNAVLEVAEGEYRTLLLVLSCTGQRLVDAVMLEWSQIDFDKKVITLVPKKTSRRTGRPVFIPLLPPLQTELGDCERKGRYVMPGLVALYDRDDSELSKKVQRLFHEAGINTSNTPKDKRKVTEVGAHSLRHTFVTIARHAGIPDPMIFQITGHSSKEMLEHYTQFTPEMVASLAAGILGRSATSTQGALPDPSGQLPDEGTNPIAEGLREAISLAERIRGKQNDDLKSELLDLLGSLEKRVDAQTCPAPA